MILVAGLFAAPMPVLAQDTNKDGFAVTERAAAPSDPDAIRYAEAARRHRIDTDMIYAIKIDGDITGGARKEPRDRNRISAPNIDGNGLGVLAMAFALIAALALWMRFGGSGMLLARAPSKTQDAEPSAAPDSWRIDADASKNPNDLLARLAEMPDRREAMVQLLRHCLLRASDDSDTRFARADTEREAFARLPGTWHHHVALKQLLRDTELVHYGGREVTAENYQRAFDLGGTILRERRYA